MGKDYYSALNITRSASRLDIQKAYRKVANKWHPVKNPDDNDAANIFLEIAEAYDVLSDARKRAVYDQFGEVGLKSGVPENSALSPDWCKGYSFHGDPLKVYSQFFGTDNPFQEFYDRVDGDMHMSFGGLKGRGEKIPDAEIRRDLLLSLEEVYHGCEKKVQISRKILNDDGVTTSTRDKLLTVHVEAGWRQNTCVRFAEHGDQGPHNRAADLVFVLRDQPHPVFQRDEDGTLVHVARISLCQALTGCTIRLRTLDDRIINIPINDIVHHGYEKRVPDEGMPSPGKSGEWAELVIRFEVEFPRKLSPSQRHLLARILDM